MKQLLIRRGKPFIAHVSVPAPEAHQVLVQVHYSCTSSGTEIATVHNAAQSLIHKAVSNIADTTTKLFGAVQEHGVAATAALIMEKNNQHMSLGYSCSGVIQAVGNSVKHYRVGDFVACAGAGFAQHSDYIVAPEMLVAKVTQPERLKEASMSTIAAIALQGVRRSQLKLGDKICVIGLGLLGQLTAQLAAHAGAEVIGIDLDENRCLLAQELAGATTVCPTKQDTLQAINYFSSFYGVDATIITASSSTARLIDDAIAYTRKAGNIVIVGDTPLNFEREALYQKEQNILISTSYGPGRYDHNYELYSKDYPYHLVRWTEQRNLEHCAKMIEREILKIKPLIGATVAIDDAADIYTKLASSKWLSMVIKYPGKETPTQPRINEKKAPSKLEVACLGSGGFAKTMLLPTLVTLDNVHIKVIADKDVAAAHTLAGVYNATPARSLDDILDNDSINTVVIATPHAAHASQALAALQAGKAVFIEKPLATTSDDFAALQTYLANNSTAPLCVDFNRAYAPLITQLKNFIQKQPGPRAITYRMNVGYLPSSHWSQHELHGGRLIGEACHIMHLFCFLTNAAPRMISAFAQPQTNGMPQTDNCVIGATMSDGSICTLLYTAQGNKGLSKEYMELHTGGESYILNDYKTLDVFGKEKKTYSAKSKGHAELLRAACNFFSGRQEAPLPLQQLIDATNMTLAADELLKQGGGSMLL